MVQGGRSWQLFGDCRKSHKAFEDRAFSKFHDKNAGLVYFGVVTFSSTQYQKIHREVVKNGLFTVRLTIRGVGSAPSALTVSKCGNFGPIFPIIK